MKVIYKITYPNGKIYVGKDSTGDNLRYFGSPDREYLEKDFSWKEQQDITLRKEILFSSEDISESEMLKKETEFIVKSGSNNPEKRGTTFCRNRGGNTITHIRRPRKEIYFRIQRFPHSKVLFNALRLIAGY